MTKKIEAISVGGRSIHCDYWQPPSAVDLKKAVIVAYGSMGMEAEFGDMIQRLCEAVSQAGYFVALPWYFESTDTKPGIQVALTASNAVFDKWVACMSDTFRWVGTQTSPTKVALIGFSLGGNLVLKSALKLPVDAVVDFFGPVSLLQDLGSHRLSETRVAGLPRTQIHHGKLDGIVPIAESKQLKEWLEHQSVAHEVFFDYDCGHPGDLIAPKWSAAAETSSLQRTLDFLKAALQ